MDEGWPDRLGWNDGCLLREELVMELVTAMTDGLLEGFKEGSVDELGDSEGIKLGEALIDGAAYGIDEG